MHTGIPQRKEVPVMRDHEWKSSLSGLMKSFIEMNHLAGLKFEQQERFLRHFDHFCFYNGYEGETLTREMTESFIYGQGRAGQTGRCMIRKSFCSGLLNS